MVENFVDTDFPWEPLPLRRVPEGQRDHEQDDEPDSTRHGDAALRIKEPVHCPAA